MFRDADYAVLADHGNPPTVPYSPELDDVFTRFNFASDLHQDFEGMPESFFIENPAPTLLLAGDVGEAKHYKNERFQAFFKRCSEHWNNVIIIPGNHEHYGSRFIDTVRYMKEATAEFVNITIMDRGHIEINGVIVLGGTLWTNFNNGDVRAMAAAEYGMNDYYHIKGDHYSKAITPHKTYFDHRQTIKYFEEMLDKHPDKPFVVMSHHAPSYKSVDPNYIREELINHAYASDLESFILAHPNIIHWIHGHMHTRNRYQIGDTTVHVHARGYPNQFPDHRTYKPAEIFV